jgi:molecular chaperone GrpE
MTSPSRPRPQDAHAAPPAAPQHDAERTAHITGADEAGGANAERSPEQPRGAAADPHAALAQMEDRWRRALADADNLRKRYQREIEEARAAERARVAAELLPVVDNLELALQHAAADPASIVAGVQAVRDQAVDALARLGFERIEDSGVRFDPSRHEACRVVPDADAEPNTVLAVIRPGYTAPSGLLRAAMVAVAARPAGRQERT